jgi:hypothetical protein
MIIFFIISLAWSQTSLLEQFKKAGIWDIDRKNHRCFVDPEPWALIPFQQKEQCLYVIYSEEKTWWELYDKFSGKLLGKVNSWGAKIYP